MIRYRTTCGIICQFVMCLLIFLSSCSDRVDTTEDLSIYYVPIDSIGERGIRYIYRSLADTTLDQEVWEYAKTSENHITSINYDHNQQVVQKQYERIVESGVLIDSLILYFNDEGGRIISYPVRILSPHRFPFAARDSSQVWLTQLEWWQPGDSLHVVLERRRRFDGDTTWSWQGQSIPAIKFKTVDKFETEQDGWTSSQWTGTEIYAKNIGMIYYKRDISKHLRLEFELDQKISVK